ncbi:MAG: hypothetical protein JWQ89_3333 [Devosia sp.]|uniref:hypothetical protein n=1 Tax=Devosia sp. TaxID=1871048 RepID=UPI0026078D01|nr:hypothetical protein [Devosia sp.]MDB5541606.1 hypothetical protein [Devosia sp.]
MAITAPVVIDVIDPSGKKHTVNGWAAEIIELVLIRQNQINALNRGHVHCDFGPTSGLSAEIAENVRGVRR